jgi:hypothetical protein
VSSKWLKDLLCADEAQPEIEHDEPAETKGMNNTELFKLTIGRLKKIRYIIFLYLVRNSRVLKLFFFVLQTLIATIPVVTLAAD